MTLYGKGRRERERLVGKRGWRGGSVAGQNNHNNKRIHRVHHGEGRGTPGRLSLPSRGRSGTVDRTAVGGVRQENRRRCDGGPDSPPTCRLPDSGGGGERPTVKEN